MDFEKNPSPNTSSAPYRVYNIGNNNPVNLMDFITAIEKKIGKTVKKVVKSPLGKAALTGAMMFGMPGTTAAVSRWPSCKTAAELAELQEQRSVATQELSQKDDTKA